MSTVTQVTQVSRDGLRVFSRDEIHNLAKRVARKLKGTSATSAGEPYRKRGGNRWLVLLVNGHKNHHKDYLFQVSGVCKEKVVQVAMDHARGVVGVTGELAPQGDPFEDFYWIVPFGGKLTVRLDQFGHVV